MSFTYKADYDRYGNPHLRDEGEILELVKIDAKRVFYLLGPRMGGIAVIRRSLNGYHLNFPFSRLKREEIEWLIEYSFMDSGYKYWVRERGCSTLRTSKKTILKEVGDNSWTKRIVGKRTIEDIPFIVCIIKNPWMA